MKKFLYPALALGAIASLASCASDEPLNTPDGDGVRLTLSLPDAMMTRASNAFGDGLDAVNLTYAVYNSKGTLIMSETKASFFDGTNLTNTLSLDLLNGETYNIIFWADAFGAGDTESPFIFSTDDKTVTVNYLKMGANSEKYDAFYASDDLTVNGPVSKTIKLYRPFAQINFGTNDLDKPAVTKEFGENWANLQTTYTVSGLANTLNLATGAVSQNTDYGTSYTAAVGIPTGQTFPKVTVNGQAVTGLKYLQMDYILAGKGTNDIAEFDLEIANSSSNKVFNTIKVPNAPYQANYRTNIYGQLLTTTNDFVVEIVPIFETPDYNEQVYVWDGTTVTIPEIETDADGTKHVEIYGPSQLAGLQQLAAENDLSEVVINIRQDMDMDGKRFTQLGTSSKHFNVKMLDGNGHSIKNVSRALINYAGDMTAQNLTVEAQNASGAAIISSSYGNVNLNNITVNGSVTGSLGGAGLVKYQYEGTLTLTGCTNNATITDGLYCAGGLVARTAGTKTVLTGCTNNGDVTCTRSGGAKAAGMIGMPAAPVEMQNCTNTGNITITTNRGGCAAAGIVGWFNGSLDLKGCSSSKGKITINYNGTSCSDLILAGGMYGGSGWGNIQKVFTNCSNSSEIIVNAPNIASDDNAYNHAIYAGGIVASTSYDPVFSMTGCTSSGKITVNQGVHKLAAYVGGLVGAIGWEKNVVFTDNTIEASCVLSGGSHTAAVLNNMSNPGDMNITLSGTVNKTPYAATTGF